MLALHNYLICKQCVNSKLPHEYKIYKPAPGLEENFCLMDRGTSKHSIIILGKETSLEYLATSSIWYVDGTFAIAPHLFHWMRIILVKRHEGEDSVLYALLKNKQSNLFEKD